MRVEFASLIAEICLLSLQNFPSHFATHTTHERSAGHLRLLCKWITPPFVFSHSLSLNSLPPPSFIIYFFIYFISELTRSCGQCLAGRRNQDKILVRVGFVYFRRGKSARPPRRRSLALSSEDDYHRLSLHLSGVRARARARAHICSLCLCARMCGFRGSLQVCRLW